MERIKSSRRLSIEHSEDAIVIRFQWCQTFFRYAIFAFLVLAVTILFTEHSGHAFSLREAVELTWAAMLLGLVLIFAINSTEVRVTPDAVHVRCMPVAIYAERTIPRRNIIAVHHWLYLNKGARHRLAIQSGYPVRLGTFDTRDEAQQAAEAIAGKVEVPCREVPARGIDRIQARAALRIVALLTAPWMFLLVLTAVGM